MAGETQTKWSQEQVKAFLELEKPGYQKIQLPYGLSTNGHDRPQIKELAFNDVQGKSVLDIGSCFGGFCIEALQRGASRATGIELSRKRIKAAKTMADMLGLNADFRFEDIEKNEITQKSDITLCLDVLHHLRNPFSVLRKLTDITNEKLVLEVASAGTHDRKKFKIGMIFGSMISRIQAILVGPYNPHGRRQTYFFTKSAMKTILGSHRKVFHKVNIIDFEFKGRFIVVAEKMRINRMVLICGLTSSGKSTFREMYLKGDFSGQIAPVDKKETIFIGAQAIGKYPLDQTFPHNICENLVYHYDISRKETLDTYSFDRDVSTDLITLVSELDVAIVAPDIASLRQQLQNSELNKPEKKHRKKHVELSQLYQDPEWVEQIYCDFIDFCAEACTGKINFNIYCGPANDKKLISVKGQEKAKALIRKIYR